MRACLGELDRIIGKALEENPTERYQHAEDMLVDIRRLKGQRVLPTPNTVVRNQKRRRGYLYAGLGVAALLVSAGLASLLVRSRPAARAGPEHMEQITAFTDSAVMPTLSPDGGC